TLLKTIVGLLPPENGDVRLSTMDIGYISDELYFNDSTLFDYLSDGGPGEEAVLGILEKLKLMGSVDKLTEGIHTPIVNNNVPFSGGEIVRLKIARVLLKRPGIIVMDEPTEFLDAETESIVLDHLNEFKEISTIIAVVHRQRLLNISDTHYHLENKKRVGCSIWLGVIGSLIGMSVFGLSWYMISLSSFEPPIFVILLIISMIKLFGMAKGGLKYLERLMSHNSTFKLISRMRTRYF